MPPTETACKQNLESYRFRERWKGSTVHWFFRKKLGPAMLGIALLEGRKGGWPGRYWMKRCIRNGTCPCRILQRGKQSESYRGSGGISPGLSYWHLCSSRIEIEIKSSTLSWQWEIYLVPLWDTFQFLSIMHLPHLNDPSVFLGVRDFSYHPSRVSGSIR